MQPARANLDEPVGRLTLARALAQTLIGSPELASASFDTRSAEARTLQAGYRPNPEITGQIEDFGGNRQRSGFRDSQATVALSQAVEVGAKRASRLRLARLDENLAAWDYEAKRLDVFVEATKAFVEVLKAQRKLELAEATLRTEQQFFNAVGERVRAGQVTPIEQQRAQVLLSNGRIAIEKARRDLAGARVRLAALWGSREPRFERVEGNLNDVTRPPPLDQLAALAAQNPDLERWESEIQQREAKLAVERSKNVADVTFNAGVRKYGDGGTAFVGGIGIPINVFGLNRGNILDAQLQLDKGRAQRRAAEVRVASAVRQSFEQLAGAYEEVALIRREVLPAAEAAYNGARTGYGEGKFGLLEVLDAQRALTDARNRLVDASGAYHAALADAERLTGQSLKARSPGSRAGETP